MLFIFSPLISSGYDIEHNFRGGHYFRNKLLILQSTSLDVFFLHGRQMMNKSRNGPKINFTGWIRKVLKGSTSESRQTLDNFHVDCFSIYIRKWTQLFCNQFFILHAYISFSTRNNQRVWKVCFQHGIENKVRAELQRRFLVMKQEKKLRIQRSFVNESEAELSRANQRMDETSEKTFRWKFRGGLHQEFQRRHFASYNGF